MPLRHPFPDLGWNSKDGGLSLLVIGVDLHAEHESGD
jgi:hypothetical protein